MRIESVVMSPRHPGRSLVSSPAMRAAIASKSGSTAFSVCTDGLRVPRSAKKAANHSGRANLLVAGAVRHAISISWIIAIILKRYGDAGAQQEDRPDLKNCHGDVMEAAQ